MGCAGVTSETGRIIDRPADGIFVIPWRDTQDGFLSPDADNTAASLMIPSREKKDLKQVDVKALGGLDNGLTLLTATSDFSSVQDGKYLQLILSRANLPPGGSLTPSNVQDALSRLIRGDAFVEATWADSEEADAPSVLDDNIEDVLVGGFNGSIEPLGNNGAELPEFPVGEGGATIRFDQSVPGTYSFDINSSRYTIIFGLSVTSNLDQSIPTISRVNLTDSNGTESLQLRRISDDPIRIAVSGDGGIPSDGNPSFRDLRSFVVAAEKGHLRVSVQFNGIDSPVILPLCPSHPLPNQ